MIEKWTYAQDVEFQKFDGEITYILECYVPQTIKFPLPSNLRNYLQFELVSDIVVVESWSIKLNPIQTLFKWEVTDSVSVIQRYISASLYLKMTSSSTGIASHFVKGFHSSGPIVSIPTTWFQVAIEYVFAANSLRLFLNNMVNPYLTIGSVNFPTPPTCMIGSINGIFDNVFFFDDRLTSVNFSNWIFDYTPKGYTEILSNGTLSSAICNNLPSQVFFKSTPDYLVSIFSIDGFGSLITDINSI